MRGITHPDVVPGAIAQEAVQLLCSTVPKDPENIIGGEDCRQLIAGVTRFLHHYSAVQEANNYEGVAVTGC